MKVFEILFLGLCLAVSSVLFVMGLDLLKGYAMWFARVVAAGLMATAFICVWVAMWRGLTWST
jgi:hypothetical protein